MTICVSTVSPRALDRLMEETVPAASFGPTRTRLDATHTGNAAPDVVLNAMRAVKTTGTVAANKRLLMRLELPCTGSPLFRPADCSWMFINSAPPRQSIFLDWEGAKQKKFGLLFLERLFVGSTGETSAFLGIRHQRWRWFLFSQNCQIRVV